MVHIGQKRTDACLLQTRSEEFHEPTSCLILFLPLTEAINHIVYV